MNDQKESRAVIPEERVKKGTEDDGGGDGDDGEE